MAYKTDTPIVPTGSSIPVDRETGTLLILERARLASRFGGRTRDTINSNICR